MHLVNFKEAELELESFSKEWDLKSAMNRFMLEYEDRLGGLVWHLHKIIYRV